MTHAEFKFTPRAPLPRVTARNLAHFQTLLKETPPRGAKEVQEGDALLVRVVCETRVVWFRRTENAIRTLRHYGVTP